uniref:Ubiquitin carboxyl-terminal hydrolase 36 n=1 Tax=Haemonchus contortus TaxID=6289 RepID=A0A6F7Q9L9_HAECO
MDVSLVPCEMILSAKIYFGNPMTMECPLLDVAQSGRPTDNSENSCGTSRITSLVLLEHNYCKPAWMLQSSPHNHEVRRGSSPTKRSLDGKRLRSRYIQTGSPPGCGSTRKRLNVKWPKDSHGQSTKVEELSLTQEPTIHANCSGAPVEPVELASNCSCSSLESRRCTSPDRKRRKSESESVAHEKAVSSLPTLSSHQNGVSNKSYVAAEPCSSKTLSTCKSKINDGNLVAENGFTVSSPFHRSNITAMKTSDPVNYGSGSCKSSFTTSEPCSSRTVFNGVNKNNSDDFEADNEFMMSFPFCDSNSAQSTVAGSIKSQNGTSKEKLVSPNARSIVSPEPCSSRICNDRSNSITPKSKIESNGGTSSGPPCKSVRPKALSEPLTNGHRSNKQEEAVVKSSQTFAVEPSSNGGTQNSSQYQGDVITKRVCELPEKGKKTSEEPTDVKEARTEKSADKGPCVKVLESLSRARTLSGNELSRNKIGRKSFPFSDPRLEGIWTFNNFAPIKGRKHFPGIVNAGVSCFLNSVMQALVHLAPFTRYIVEKHEHLQGTQKGPCVSCALRHNYFKAAFQYPRTLDLSWMTKRYWKQICGRYYTYQQEDAHEFLLNFIGTLDRESSERSKSDPVTKSTPLEQIFFGRIRKEMECSCGAFKIRYQKFLDLNLAIPPNTNRHQRLTTTDLLKFFVKKQQVEHKCERCGRNMCHTHLIYRCPAILILQVLCFNNAGNKIYRQIDIERFLSLNPFTYSKQEDGLYELTAVVSHEGVLNNGHYIAMVKGFDKKFRYFDDEFVSDANPPGRHGGFYPYLIIYSLKTSGDVKHDSNERSGLSPSPNKWAPKSFVQDKNGTIPASNSTKRNGQFSMKRSYSADYLTPAFARSGKAKLP